MSDNTGKANISRDKDGSDSESESKSSNKNDGNKPGTSPIEIKKAQGSSKFGVISSRQSTSGQMTDSNGEPIPLDRIIRTANTMSSMMMAHKIALEDDFRLEPGMDISGPLMSLSPIIGSSPTRGPSSGQISEPSLQSRVKDIVHEAYWDLFKEELQKQASEDKNERKFDISKQLLRDIKQKIIDLLLPQHSRLKEEIEDRLDSKILDQLSAIESLNLLDYARYILNVLSKLCAPVRDEKLRELTETIDIVQLYKGIMELLELMRLDFANFTLNRFKPHIKAHSQDYEREKFNEILKQQQSIGIDGLEYTRIWLARAVEKVDDLHGLSDLVNKSSEFELSQEEMSSPIMSESEPSTTYSKEEKILRSEVINIILNVAYCELLEWSVDKQKLYPETLLFDEATFKQLGEQYKVLVLTSSILLTTFAFVNRFKLQDDNDFRILIKSHVITLATASYDESSKSSNDLTSATSTDGILDRVRLETIAASLIKDIGQRLELTNKTSLDSFDGQKDLLLRQILDLQNSTNRVKELARRRILEFVETLLTLDVKHQQKKCSSGAPPPPVNIPLGLNCLTDEITLTMAQLVKIIRYNRRVFFQHYQSIIVYLVSKKI